MADNLHEDGAPMKSTPFLGAALVAAGISGCVGHVSDPMAESGSGGAGVAPGSGSGGRSVTGTGGNSAGSGGSPTSGSGGSSGNIGTGSGGSGSATGGMGGMYGPKPLDLAGSPRYYRFVRLTNAQWAQSVQDILKLSAPSGLESVFQDTVAGASDFSNNELFLDVSQRSWSDFQAAAETLAAQVTATDAALQKVVTGTDAATFIQTFGRRAYRRPLTSAEVTKYMAIHTTGSTMSGSQSAFTKGAALVIRTMLQSPNFLYRAELTPTGTPLTSYEMAAKLSLWLRGTTPNDALLDTASGPGKLDTADGAAALTQTMLGETTAAATLQAFHAELLTFAGYPEIIKTGVAGYTDALNDELLQSSILFFNKVFSQGLGVKDILTSTSGFVGPAMAKIYGVTAPSAGQFVERDLGPKRVGYFSQLPYLALYGINAQPDSIHRGVKILKNILCIDPGMPNANVGSVPMPSTGLTNRETITNLTGGCGAECHGGYINPIGFAFENYDGIGQWRDTEKVTTDTAGQTMDRSIDSSGKFPFAEGTKSFSDAAELMPLLASSGQTHACYAKKLASFSLQRDLVVGDMPLIDALKTTSMGSQGSIKQIVVDLVKNNAFRTHVGGAQ
jgi:hypothetical protein